jgi:hypothetical protein
MARVIFGNHSSVLVPRRQRDRIRKFYCEVLEGELVQASYERDLIRLGEEFYIAFLYGDDVPDEGEFLRSGKSVWLEIKTDDVEQTALRIFEFGVRRLEVPDPHLYFQAPGGQCLRLVGIDEDLSFYEGFAEGPNVARVRAALSTAQAS